MILHLGERVACEECIRGHRAADCCHLGKYLIEIKGRGRPGAKDPLLRFRIDPHPQVIRESMEKVENKNGRSKPGSKKRCFHLADNVTGTIHKVDLSNSFKVLGPATEKDITDFESNSTMKFNFSKRQNYKRPKKSDDQGFDINAKLHSVETDRRVSTDSSNIDISRNSSIFSLQGNTSDQSFELISPPLSGSNSRNKRSLDVFLEDDYKDFKNHSVSNKQASMDEIYESLNFPTIAHHENPAYEFCYNQNYHEFDEAAVMSTQLQTEAASSSISDVVSSTQFNITTSITNNYIQYNGDAVSNEVTNSVGIEGQEQKSNVENQVNSCSIYEHLTDVFGPALTQEASTDAGNHPSQCSTLRRTDSSSTVQGHTASIYSPSFAMLGESELENWNLE